MMKNYFKLSFVLAGLLAVSFSCDQDEVLQHRKGSAAFSVQTGNVVGNGRLGETRTPAFVFISVETANGNEVIENLKLSLIPFGTSYVTGSVELETGSYRLVSFLVLDEDLNTIYATPIEGSEKADLVNDPLPILFTITEDDATTVAPQVVPVRGDDEPEQFGYTSFSFDIVDDIVNVRIKLELTVGQITYLYANAEINVYGYSRDNVLQWTGQFDYAGLEPEDLGVKSGYHHYKFEVNRYGVNVGQTINGTDLLEASQGPVPVTFVLSGSAPAKKLSHYITYMEVADPGEWGATYLMPQTKIQYSYGASGRLSKMTVLNYNDTTDQFIEQRYFLFNYDNDLVSKISGYQSGTQQSYIEETHAYLPDGNVASIVQVNAATGITAQATFTHSYTNRVLNASYTFSNGGAFQYEMSLPYGNARTDRTSRGSQLCSTGSYLYDNGINPFKHLGYVDFLLQNYSLNNKVAEDVQYLACAFPSLIAEQYVFEYDDDGYPVSETTLYRGRSFTTQKRFFYQ